MKLGVIPSGGAWSGKCSKLPMLDSDPVAAMVFFWFRERETPAYDAFEYRNLVEQILTNVRTYLSLICWALKGSRAHTGHP